MTMGKLAPSAQSRCLNVRATRARVRGIPRADVDVVAVRIDTTACDRGLQACQVHYRLAVGLRVGQHGFFAGGP
jgi:hypothetical protein